MRDRKSLLWVGGLLLVVVGAVFAASHGGGSGGKGDRLAVLWTSGDSEVAHKVCFMYTHNAKKAKWFDEVTLVIWGPSSRLLAGDKSLEAAIKAMMADGVVVQACQACADMYGVSDDIRKMGIEVKYMGSPLTDMLKSGYKVLTF